MGYSIGHAPEAEYSISSRRHDEPAQRIAGEVWKRAIVPTQETGLTQVVIPYIDDINFVLGNNSEPSSSLWFEIDNCGPLFGLIQHGLEFQSAEALPLSVET